MHKAHLSDTEADTIMALIEDEKIFYRSRIQFINVLAKVSAVCVSVCLCVCLCVCLSVCLSVHPSLHRRATQ
jgi:hypothetical protein